MRNFIIFVMAITIIGLVTYMLWPKKLKLVTTTEAVVAECGMTTFYFDPPMTSDAGSFRIIRLTADGDVVSMEVYATKE